MDIRLIRRALHENIETWLRRLHEIDEQETKLHAPSRGRTELNASVMESGRHSETIEIDVNYPAIDMQQSFEITIVRTS